MKKIKRFDYVKRLYAFLLLVLFLIVLCVPVSASYTSSSGDSIATYSPYLDLDVRFTSMIGGFYYNDYISGIGNLGSLSDGSSGVGSVAFSGENFIYASEYSTDNYSTLDNRYTWNTLYSDYWNLYDNGCVSSVRYSTPSGVIYNFDSVLNSSYPLYCSLYTSSIIPYEPNDYTDDFVWVYIVTYTQYLWNDDYTDLDASTVSISFDSGENNDYLYGYVEDSTLYDEWSIYVSEFDLYGWLSSKISTLDGFVFSDLSLDVVCLPKFNVDLLPNYYPVSDNDGVREGYLDFVAYTDQIPLYNVEFFSYVCDPSIYTDSITRLFGTVDDNGGGGSIDFEDINPISYLGNVVSSFLDIELFPHFTFGTVIYVVLGIGLLSLFLKYFAGG